MFYFDTLKLSAKINLFILFSVIVASLIVSGYFGFYLSDSISEDMLDDLSVVAENASGYVDEQTLVIESNTNDFAKVVLDDFDYSLALNDKNYLLTHMKSYLDYESNLLEFLKNSNLGVVSIYDIYNVDEMKGVYENWFVVDSNGEVKLRENEPLETFNPSDPDMGWYYDPKKIGSSMWTGVYEDSQTGVLMFSYVVPMFSKNYFVGVVGVDVSLEGEQEYVNSLNSEIDDEVFILDEKDNYITRPSVEVDSELFALFKNSSKTKNEGYVFGKNDTLFFKKLSNGHIVVSFIPNSLISKRIYSIWVIAALVCLIIILSFSILGTVFSKRITRSLENLQVVSKEIEKGNFKVRAEVTSKDELGELAKTFNKAITSLENIDKEHAQLEKAKTEFLSITSHELRSPMTPMKAQLQMLQGGYFGKMNAKQVEAVDVVLRNTVRLDNIIVDFLEISRIEAARLKFNFIKTSLSPYVKRLKEEMDAFLSEKKITLVMEVPMLPVIEVDPDRVMQVLRNLVNNAKKFSPDKSKIIVSAKVVDGMIQFSVKDFGAGIPKTAQSRIFEPFFQAEQTMYRKVGGNGLGLTICKGIVESQNGKIWFTSEEGKGTTFHFTVPFEPVKEGKSIKLLFSTKESEESKILELFKEVLGPLGEKEFTVMKGDKELIEDMVIGYVDFVLSKNIISKEQAKEFKNKVRLVYGYKAESELNDGTKKVSEADLDQFLEKRSE